MADETTTATGARLGPLERLAVKRRFREKLAKRKVKGKALTSLAQSDYLRMVDNDTIDAAYAQVLAGEANGEGDAHAQGPFLDWLISSGLIDKIVELLFKLIGI